MQEDDKVRELVKQHGPKHWSMIARELPGRVGKQCRERYGQFKCTTKPDDAVLVPQSKEGVRNG